MRGKKRDGYIKQFSLNLNPLNHNRCEGRAVHLSRILKAASSAASLDKPDSECLFSEHPRGMNGPAEFTIAIKNRLSTRVWSDAYSRVKNKHTKAAT